MYFENQVHFALEAVFYGSHTDEVNNRLTEYEAYAVGQMKEYFFSEFNSVNFAERTYAVWPAIWNDSNNCSNYNQLTNTED